MAVFSGIVPNYSNLTISSQVSSLQLYELEILLKSSELICVFAIFRTLIIFFWNITDIKDASSLDRLEKI